MNKKGEPISIKYHVPSLIKKGELIEGDIFRIIVRIPGFGEVTPQVTPQVRKLIMIVKGEMTRSELMMVLSLRDRMHFSREYLYLALESGYIERTIPDKPNSRFQKYRVTKSGKDFVKELGK